MHYVILSTSLNPQSKSEILVRTLAAELTSKNLSVDYLDLRTLTLPFCDGGAAFSDQNTQKLVAILEKADGIVIGLAIHNWSVAASAKNVIELAGDAFKGKVVGVVAAAGGPRALMGPLAFLNSIMMDFGSFIVPKVIVAGPDAFEDDSVPTAETKRRLGEFGELLTKMTTALR